METNQENKSKFFAQYWGQKIFKRRRYSGGHILQQVFLSSTYGFLELKPLSSISDEDAIEACKVAYSLTFDYEAKWTIEVDAEIGFLTVKSKGSHHSFDIDFESGIISQYQDEFNETGNTMNHYSVCDYLRSKGYALPWMGLPVEEMVDAGWIKIALLT